MSCCLGELSEKALHCGTFGFLRCSNSLQAAPAPHSAPVAAAAAAAHSGEPCEGTCQLPACVLVLMRLGVGRVGHPAQVPGFPPRAAGSWFSGPAQELLVPWFSSPAQERLVPWFSVGSQDQLVPWFSVGSPEWLVPWFSVGSPERLVPWLSVGSQDQLSGWFPGSVSVLRTIWYPGLLDRGSQERQVPGLVDRWFSGAAHSPVAALALGHGRCVLQRPGGRPWNHNLGSPTLARSPCVLVQLTCGEPRQHPPPYAQLISPLSARRPLSSGHQLCTLLMVHPPLFICANSPGARCLTYCTDNLPEEVNLGQCGSTEFWGWKTEFSN
ncbi:unnamed protein product [Boreogadus saida]